VSNLLVVDWDYFFPNPFEAADVEDRTIWLYDWGHREMTPRQDWLWPMRASGFLRAKLPLPKVEVPDNWWSRFNIAEDASLFVADSNLWTGTINAPDGGAFDQVWLYDAHHDAYKIKTQKELATWQERGRITCEDWMFVHHLAGSNLHWRWPTWLPKPSNSEWPNWLNLDASQDDLLPVAVEFDTVSLCQSAAWVPPWNDSEFLTLINTCPVDVVEQLDDDDLVRDFDISAAEQQAEMARQLMNQ
jgi:hypothetical protein